MACYAERPSSLREGTASCARPWRPAALVTAALLVFTALVAAGCCTRVQTPPPAPVDKGASRAAWTIAYVDEQGIVTLDATGRRTSVKAPAGQDADWSPDQTHLAMIQYARADMAYENDVALVAYPSGKVTRPFKGEWNQIEYHGWRTDSSAVEVGDLDGGTWAIAAGSGQLDEIFSVTAPGRAKPTALPDDVLRTLKAAIEATTTPAIGPGSNWEELRVWHSPDGSMLLIDSRIWRNTDQETAAIFREATVWLADSDGGGLRRIGSGHSPVWIRPGAEPVAVPKVVGKAETEAKALLVKAGFKAESVTNVAAAKKGTVIAQDPSGGMAQPHHGVHRRRDGQGSGCAEARRGRSRGQVEVGGVNRPRFDGGSVPRTT